MERKILCIDFKSFYASCECVDRGLNPFNTKLVVADKSRGSGTIILAVSPCLKAFGVPSRLRLYQLPKMDDIVIAKPRMSRYLEVSAKAISIFLKYICEDDLHVYSIDESFLDVTHYLKFYGMSAFELAKKIKQSIYEELGLTVTIGIGSNMFLAKVAMDVEAKKTIDEIAEWTEQDIKTKLQTIKPLTKIWSIGGRMEKRLNAMGFYTLKDIAECPKKVFTDAFGIIGGELHDHANGIDHADIRKKYFTDNHSYSVGQVFLRDYTLEEIPLIISEMLEDILIRMRFEHLLAKKIFLCISYSKEICGGFCRQTQLIEYTDSKKNIYDGFLYLLSKYAHDFPIRRISLCVGDFVKSDYYQPDLFTDIEEQEKERHLNVVLDQIKNKYGVNSIFTASQLFPSSNAIERHKKIGGHAK